ncbi:flagellar hook-length control protein FliK [uncultured Pseudoteredinibacter sp.]|uniref:flagellar hook-length control protein FliK n=1 Tax=uncultured Pseudoteredinibacter sp. TaxID=1641701 RepID=UPI002603DE25|nr:flagellar hook-length control protein FliK [uncultured Pseudoteredinibacter sp.]
MPATTSDLLLNSLSSVNPTPKNSSRQTAGTSFSEHWAAQSQLGQQTGSASASELGEGPDYSRRQANDNSRDKSDSANSSRELDHSRNRSNHRQDVSSSRRDNDRADNHRAQPAQEKPDGAVGRSEKLNRSEETERGTESGAGKPNETKSEPQSNEVPLVPDETTYGDMSSEEKFILALLGVSIPESSVESDTMTTSDELPTGEDLGLDSGAILFSGENTEVELDAEALAVVELPDDQPLTEESQTGDLILDDSSLLQAAAPAATVQASETNSVKTIDAELAAKLASINRQNQSSSILPETSNNPTEEGAEELASDLSLSTVSDPKLKSASAELAPISKLTTNQLFKEVSSAPSASAYGESTGVSHSQSLGRTSGMEHSFQLQRGADVQGRSTMQSDIAQPQWKAEIAEKVAWFSARNISKAEIRLDPPELGSLQIKIQLNQEQAQVSFNSPHASVREALDQSSSRLREMFQEQGLNLADVNVGGEGAQQHSEGDSGGSRAAFDDDLVETEAVQQPLRQSLSLVDSYV